MGEQVTAPEAAQRLRIPVDRIYDWRRRQLVVPVGLLPGASRAGGIPKYDLDELKPLARRYHRRAATRRQPPR